MEDEYRACIKTWFGRLAPYYGIFDTLVKGIRAVVVDVADAPLDARILDVATGTGAQAFAFAQRGHAVVGVDLSEAMLDVAKRHNTYDNVTFEVADAAQMPFDDDQFDVSCICFALHDMPSLIRERVLQEMVRVSKSNGTVMIVDYAVPAKNAWHSLLLRLARWGETAYFPKFVTSDFQPLLKKVGIGIEMEVAVLMGLGQITRGINRKEPRKDRRL
jgi:ubiquinone/menaquinone biosynthesis C-methylase UbiE